MVYHESKIIAYLFTFVESLQLKGILPTFCEHLDEQHGKNMSFI